MLLVFCVLGFLFVFLLLFLSLKIRITIKGEKKSKNLKLEEELPWQFELSFYIFNDIKIGTRKITKEKLAKMIEMSKNKPWGDFKKNKVGFTSLLKEVQNLKPEIERFHLSFHLGTENSILTSSLVVFFSTFFSILLANLIKISKGETIQYEILPCYQEKNQYNLKVDCIIQVKMVHIIYVIYRVIKRKEIDKNGKSSNRRSYEHSYEQH